MLSSVYGWTHEYILDERMTILWMYYDWAVYDSMYDLHVKIMTMV